ncbi:MAG: TrmB family transcriptional regulator [Candidatus Hodarchaeales archaeon]
MFGLSNYESRAYLTLLSSGIMTAKGISVESNIPFGRVYDVLKSLEDKGLVDKQESRPKKFVSKEPRIALNNLLSMKQVELQSLTEKASIVEEKLTHLQSEKPEESLFWSVALYDDKAISRYIEKISEAEKEIQIIIDIRVAARTQQKGIIKNLISIIKLLSSNGVSVDVLLSGVKPGSLEEKYLTSISKFFDVLDKAKVRHCLNCTTAFDVIDNEKVLVKVMNPVKPDEFFAWIFVWQKKFAEELKSKFQELWMNATELKIELV